MCGSSSLIGQTRPDKKKLYVCFVDFKKADDSVPQHLLWAKLERKWCEWLAVGCNKGTLLQIFQCVLRQLKD